MNPIETAVQGVKDGNIECFEIVVETFQQQLFRYCYRMLGNLQEAEDAVQEAFLKAFDKIHSYKNSSNFSSWIYKITYNHCISLIRRKKMLQFVPFLETNIPENEDVGKSFEEFQINKEINLVLKRLSIEDRCIVILKNIDEKSFEEIAQILNLKPATVRKRYERLRKKLRVGFQEIKGGIVNEDYSIN